MTFDDSNNVYQDVISGNSAACFEDKPVMQYAIATGLGLKLGNMKMAMANDYGIAVSKSNPELVKKINAGLKKVRKSGEYTKIVEKYLAMGPRPTRIKRPRKPTTPAAPSWAY